MAGLFNSIIYQPILALLVWIYQTVAFHDLGIAIVALTILVRIVLFPVFYKGSRDQTIMQHLQPHVKKIQLDHKDEKEVQAKKLMALYSRYKINPLSGFLLLIVQLPVFIALFQIFRKELGGAVFTSQMFLGFMNLGEKSIVIAIIAALAQYIQGKISLPKAQPSSDSKNPLASMGKTMVYMGPVLTFGILMGLPAAIGLYWIVSSLFSIAQQHYINKKMPAFENLEESSKS